MWQWILLFIVLTPGVLFTIPPYGKKLAGGVSGKVVTAILHGVVFAAAAWFLMLCKEGFQASTLEEVGQAVSNLVAGESGTLVSTGLGCPVTQHEVDIPTCTSCPAGFSCNGQRKLKCQPGTKSAAGEGVCTSCPDGQVPDLKRTACITKDIRPTCLSGTGGIKTGSTWGATCETCPAGTYSSSPLDSSSSPLTTRKCATCPTSKPYSNAGAINSTNCRATQ